MGAFIGTPTWYVKIADHIVGLSTILDNESNAMLQDHAYLCNQDGMVEVTVSHIGGTLDIIGYGDSDSNPVAGGNIRGRHKTGTYGDPGSGIYQFTFLMSKGRYFEITATGASVVIRWIPFAALVACSDYN